MAQTGKVTNIGDRKPRAKAPENETKADKFKRLGTTRMNKALSGIVGMQKLANRNQYDWTEAEADAIMEAINAHVASLKENLYRPAGAKADKGSMFAFGQPVTDAG